jgi:hypothetical protein
LGIISSIPTFDAPDRTDSGTGSNTGTTPTEVVAGTEDAPSGADSGIGGDTGDTPIDLEDVPSRQDMGHGENKSFTTPIALEPMMDFPGDTDAGTGTDVTTAVTDVENAPDRTDAGDGEDVVGTTPTAIAPASGSAHSLFATTTDRTNNSRTGKALNTSAGTGSAYAKVGGGSLTGQDESTGGSVYAKLYKVASNGSLTEIAGGASISIPSGLIEHRDPDGTGASYTYTERTITMTPNASEAIRTVASGEALALIVYCDDALTDPTYVYHITDDIGPIVIGTDTITVTYAMGGYVQWDEEEFTYWEYWIRFGNDTSAQRVKAANVYW